MFIYNHWECLQLLPADGFWFFDFLSHILSGAQNVAYFFSLLEEQFRPGFNHYLLTPMTTPFCAGDNLFLLSCRNSFWGVQHDLKINNKWTQTTRISRQFASAVRQYSLWKLWVILISPQSSFLTALCCQKPLAHRSEPKLSVAGIVCNLITFHFILTS